MKIQNSLRIFVVLPMYGGSLPIGRYCARAFQEMEHTVGVFEAPVLYEAYLALKNLKLSPDQIIRIEDSFLKLVTQALAMQIDAFKPNFVFAVAQAPLGAQLLHKLRQENIKTAMWFVEDYRLFDYWKSLAPLYDVFAVIQKEPFIAKLHTLGQPNVLYLPLAAHPDIHMPVDLSKKEAEEYGADLGFLGAGYPNRRIAFRGLAERNFKIWGSDWDNETVLAKNIQRGGARIGEEESVKIYNATKININLHSSVYTDNLVSGGDFVNPRTFELAAIGAFQLVDSRQLMGELFGENELATFVSLEDMYAKIAYYLEHESERLEIAERARKKVLKEHTYEIRLKKLISYMESIYGSFQGTSKSDFIDSLNPQIKQEIETLLAKLNVNDVFSFDEILLKLRERKGKLNDLEMALLFLDEFGKQYKK